MSLRLIIAIRLAHTYLNSDCSRDFVIKISFASDKFNLNEAGFTSTYQNWWKHFETFWVVHATNGQLKMDDKVKITDLVSNPLQIRIQ